MLRAGLTLATVALSLSPVVTNSTAGQPNAISDTPTSQPAPESNESTGGPMTALGERLIAELPKIEFGYSHVSQFEAPDPKDKPFATSRTSVIAQGIGDRMRYHYTDVSIVRDPQMNVIEIKTDGYLDRHHRPISIDWEIIRQKPNGTYTTESEKLVVGDETTVFTRTDANGKTEEKKYPTPKETFVYLIGDLMRRLPTEPGQRFILRDLDPETGKLDRRTYHVTEKDGGKLISIRKHPSKVETEYYQLNDRNWIEKHAIHDLGLTFNASSDARVHAIENVFQRYRREEKKPPLVEN